MNQDYVAPVSGLRDSRIQGRLHRPVCRAERTYKGVHARTTTEPCKTGSGGLEIKPSPGSLSYRQWEAIAGF